MATSDGHRSAMQLGLFGGEEPSRPHKPVKDWTAPPSKLRLSDLPGGKRPKWMSVGHGYHKQHGLGEEWGKDWSHPPVPVPDMTPKQLASALAAQAKRLRGANDSLSSVEVLDGDA